MCGDNFFLLFFYPILVVLRYKYDLKKIMLDILKWKGKMMFYSGFPD